MRIRNNPIANSFGVSDPRIFTASKTLAPKIGDWIPKDIRHSVIKYHKELAAVPIALGYIGNARIHMGISHSLIQRTGAKSFGDILSLRKSDLLLLSRTGEMSLGTEIIRALRQTLAEVIKDRKRKPTLMVRINRIFASLSSQQIPIIEMRFGFSPQNPGKFYSILEIGNALGLTNRWVFAQSGKAIDKLRFHPSLKETYQTILDICSYLSKNQRAISLENLGIALKKEGLIEESEAVFLPPLMFFLSKIFVSLRLAYPRQGRNYCLPIGSGKYLNID
jgi:hypothetical protein